jgi:signal transduction histidine kinase
MAGIFAVETEPESAPARAGHRVSALLLRLLTAPLLVVVAGVAVAAAPLAVLGDLPGLEPAWRSLFTLTWIVGLATAVVGAAGRSFARRFRREISDRLAAQRAALESAAAGDYSVRFDVDRADEIGALAAALNTLMDSVRSRSVSQEDHDRALAQVLEGSETVARHERTAAAAELATSLVQDVRKGLNGAIGFAELAKRDSSPRIGRDLERLLDQLTRTSRVIDQFVEARPQPRAAAIGLDVVAARAAQAAQRLGGSRLEVNLRVGGGPCGIIGDAGRLHQAVMQLVSNAREAMPDGGRLTIEVARQRSTVGASEGVGTPVECLALKVSDTGRGIPTPDLERLFEPFFTTKTVESGGLGLSQVAGIMAQHGGRVKVESQEGLGTTVMLLFPLPAQSALDHSEIVVQPLAEAS